MEHLAPKNTGEPVTDCNAASHMCQDVNSVGVLLKNVNKLKYNESLKYLTSREICDTVISVCSLNGS